MLKGLCAICRSTHTRIPSSSRLPPIRSISTTLPSLRSARGFVIPHDDKPFRFARKGSTETPRLTTKDYAISPPPTPLAIVKALLGRVPEWIESDRTRDKLSAYGLSASQAQDALGVWRDELEEGLGTCTDIDTAQKRLESGGWDIPRLTDGLQSPEWVSVFEASLLRHFLSKLVASPPPTISSSTITHLSSILDVTDLTQLPFTNDCLPARSLSRHFHLHIGPTNSGKTYSALKALALAPSGAYAGPLRLLAHEVWERLNLGTVGGLDGVGRACNLITGEERRIVNEETGLISCTVEMLPVANSGGDPFDVVVVDEIQMMGDMQRGGSWTKAVMQTKAKEIHLCGDDTTVELLEKLIPSLGDKMTIHRYERLTPLVVAEESLNGDWNNVEPGDCIVTFSRTNIFAVKKMVETLAGKKCAVVYGALPPETRAEQAREFNEGRAEVLVASDAVGMGLNLKIKRMIFETLHKYNGKMEIPLPLTSVKQIAGRAGRFGMHKTVPALDADLSLPAAPEPTTGGSVTTLHSTDLPILRQLLPLPLPSLPRATLDIPFNILWTLSSLLPSSTTYASLLDHLHNLVIPPSHTTLGSSFHKIPLAEVVEEHRDRLSLEEVELFCYSPVSTRDPVSLQIFRNVIRSYAEEGHVGVMKCFGPSLLIEQLRRCEYALITIIDPEHRGSPKKQPVPSVLIQSIPLLETLHKSLVFYIWLAFRFPIAFPDQALAQEIKERTEKVLEECLERLPGLKVKKSATVVLTGKQQKGAKRLKHKTQEKVLQAAKVEKKEEKKRVEYRSKADGDRTKKKEIWKGVGVVGPTHHEGSGFGKRAVAEIR